MCLLETVIFFQQDNFYIHETRFLLKIIFENSSQPNLLILIKQSLRYTLYFSMTLQFEKTLCNVAHDITFALFFFILFNKLFNVGICRVCLILLLLLLLLLLNVIAFAISLLKLQTFVRTTAVVHESSSPLRS